MDYSTIAAFQEELGPLRKGMGPYHRPRRVDESLGQQHKIEDGLDLEPRQRRQSHESLNARAAVHSVQAPPGCNELTSKNITEG